MEVSVPRTPGFKVPEKEAQTIGLLRGSLVNSAGGIRSYFSPVGSQERFRDEVACELLFWFCRILTEEIVKRSFQEMNWENRGPETKNKACT